MKMLQADIKNLKESKKLNATVENHTWKINSLFTNQTDTEDTISLYGSNQDLQVPWTSRKTQDASTSTKSTMQDQGTSISRPSKKTTQVSHTLMVPKLLNILIPCGFNLACIVSYFKCGVKM